VGQESPLAATTYDVEDGVEDLAWAMGSRPPMFLGSGHVRLDVVPFGIREICWVRLSHTC
jgi:hypothetical protein